MNDKFDELAKGLAQSVTRRGALKKFGVGLAGIALASLGLGNNAKADPPDHCKSDADCASGLVCCNSKCVDVNLDPNNCGFCGNRCKCNERSFCYYGFCQYRDAI